MGPWRKRGDLCPKKKFYNSNLKAVNEPEVLKNVKQCFFMPTPSKKAKKCQTMTYMPNAIFACKTTLKKAKFLEFGLKNANLATLLMGCYGGGLVLCSRGVHRLDFVFFYPESGCVQQDQEFGFPSCSWIRIGFVLTALTEKTLLVVYFTDIQPVSNRSRILWI